MNGKNDTGAYITDSTWSRIKDVYSHVFVILYISVDLLISCCASKQKAFSASVEQITMSLQVAKHSMI